MKAGRAHRLLAFAATAVILASLPARAQSASERAAAAQAIFDEGVRLMNAGQAAAACPKFAASQKLDPGMGTKFRLAECYEKIGKTASAWALYIEIGDDARSAKRPEREEIVRKRAAELEPTLARMTVLVSPGSASLADLEVRRDGIPLDRAIWGVSIPVDPGEHILTTTAPGKIAWTSKPFVMRASKTVEVTVPPLENQPKVPIVVGSPPESPEIERRSLVPAVVLGGVTVVAAGIGGALLGVGAGKKGDAGTLHDQILGDKNGCVPGSGNLDSRCGDLKSQLDSAYMLQNIGGATMAIGGAAAIAAVTYLLWPAPRPKKDHATPLLVTPITGREQSGFVISGSF